MTLESVLYCVVIVSLVSAFIILLAMKLGIIEWMQTHGDVFISEMAKCNFCLSFWVGMVLWIVMACWFDCTWLVFGGMLSTPLTRMLL